MSELPPALGVCLRGVSRLSELLPASFCRELVRGVSRFSEVPPRRRICDSEAAGGAFRRKALSRIVSMEHRLRLLHPEARAVHGAAPTSVRPSSQLRNK